MYPTISYLLSDLFGTEVIPLPIQTFGFFVALAFIAAGYFLTKELKRYEALKIIHPTTIKVIKNKAIGANDYIISAITGFLIGYKFGLLFSNYDAFAHNPQGAILSTDGNVLGGIIGLIALVALKYSDYKKVAGKKEFEAKETLHPYQLSSNILMIAAVSGIIGAKLFHNLENMNELINDPIHALFSFSGLTFYGGLIAGIISVSYYVRKHGIKLVTIADITAPPVMLAYGIGRIGCHLSGDGDWGIVNNNPKPAWMSSLPDWMWSYSYPNNVINEGIDIEGCVGQYCKVLAEPVYPTPFYEAIMGVLLFLFLWNLRKKITTPGILFSIYLIVNGLERFFIEKIRVNNIQFEALGMTQAEMISSSLIILGIFGLFYFNKQAKNA